MIKDLRGGLFVWYTSDMNKVSLYVAVCIMILSAVGIIYFASNPAVNSCAPPNLGELIPAVCVHRESTNWIGIGTSAGVLTLSVIFITYIYTVQKKNK